MEQATNTAEVEVLTVEDSKMKRIFKWDKQTLQDPNPDMNAKEVIEFYSTQYPALVAGHIKSETPDYEKGTITYNIKTEFGTNG